MPNYFVPSAHLCVDHLIDWGALLRAQTLDRGIGSEGGQVDFEPDATRVRFLTPR